MVTVLMWYNTVLKDKYYVNIWGEYGDVYVTIKIIEISHLLHRETEIFYLS